MNLATDLNLKNINLAEVIADMKTCLNHIDCAETNGHISYNAWLIVSTLISQEIESVQRRNRYNIQGE